jgi:TP901 family phage tail tape measure protein
MAKQADAYSVGQLIASLGLDDAEFRRGMASAQASMQQADAAMKKASMTMSQSLDAIGKKMEKVGKKMTMMVTLPIIGAGVAAVKMQKDFEASMSKIEGLVGIGRAQVQAWEKDILRLAPALGRSPTELADALFFITSAGVKGAEAMQVLEMSAKASVAGLGETKIVADLVTSAMNAYGKENLSAAQATDILVAAVREGKAEADQLVGSMGKVLPIAAEMGVSFDQISAATAAMTRTGTTADIAATQLKAIFSTLLKPTDQAKEALEAMGTSASDLRRRIRDDGLIQTLDFLRQTTNKFGEEAMSTVFPNIRALMGVLDLMGANAEDNIEIFKQLTNATGSLDKAVQAAERTTQHKWDKALTQVKTTLTELGMSLKGTIIPLIEGFTEQLSKLTAWWNKLDESQQQNIIRMVALTAAAGPLLIVVGKLFRLIAMNPYVALAVAVAGVVTALIGLRNRNKEVFDQYSAMETIQKKTADAFATQRLEIEKLVWVAENQNIEDEKRIAAIKELNRIMPDYNGHLNTETGALEASETALSNYLDKLREKIRLQIFEEQYTEVLRKVEAAQEKVNEANDKALDAEFAKEKAAEEYGKTKQAIYVGMHRQETLESSAAQNTATAFWQASQDVASATEELQHYQNELEILNQKSGDYVINIETKVTGEKPQPKKEFPIILKPEPVEDIDMESILKDIESSTIWPEAPKTPYGNLILQTDEALERTLQLMKTFKQLGETIMHSLMMGADGFDEFGKRTLNVIREQITAYAALALTKAITTAMGGAAALGPFGLAAIPAFVGIALGLVNTALNRIPAFAEGGLVYGDTLAQVGEYPGARSNPEVIAPLSKLQGMLQVKQTQMPKEVRLRAEGRDLVGVIKFTELIQSTY